VGQVYFQEMNAMRCATWICRTTWLAALAIVLAPTFTVRADDDPPGGEKSPPPQREPQRPRVRHSQPLIDDTDGLDPAVRRRMAPPNFRLGARLVPVPPELNDQLDLKGEGLLFQHVEPDGPAGKAGIKEHDILLAVGDKSIKNLRDVIEAMNQTEGKELSVKLLRAGKPTTVSVTPSKREVVVARGSRMGDVDLTEIEKVIKEKLKKAGVDMRMEFFQPGKIFPRGAFKGPEFPDDLTVNIHKQGKSPAEIEVKKGDKTWNVKEDDLDELPDDIQIGRASCRERV
jgi:membrane-associated protease RseP (regulator of RpoE activity)